MEILWTQYLVMSILKKKFKKKKGKGKKESFGSQQSRKEHFDLGTFVWFSWEIRTLQDGILPRSISAMGFDSFWFQFPDALETDSLQDRDSSSCNISHGLWYLLVPTSRRARNRFALKLCMACSRERERKRKKKKEKKNESGHKSRHWKEYKWKFFNFVVSRYIVLGEEKKYKSNNYL